MLAEELSPRESATSQELEAALFFADDFSALGYEVEFQNFDAFELFYAVRFNVLTPNVIGYNVMYVGWEDSAPTVFNLPLDVATLVGQRLPVRGSLEFVGSASPGDLEAANLAGRVALVDRGRLPLAEQVDAIARAGAEAAIVFNDVPGDKYFWEQMLQSASIPAIGITRNQGLRLVDGLRFGRDVEVDLTALAQDAAPSRNVIARLNNDLDDDRVVVIGAHLDTVPSTQGANDNGSGLAVVSVLAEELADDELPFDLRFVLFGAEETGLNGSYHYVRELTPEERSRIAVMINLDSVGLGGITVTGSEGPLSVANKVSPAIVRYSGDESLGRDKSLGSDHTPFLAAGVDSLFIYADSLVYINSTEDIMERVEPYALSVAASFALGIIQQLAYQAQSSSRR